ncbi:MAG: transglutaminase family protein [Deltaproteobacteria bacterium]|nr:transglutaminase family protein [Deltaproteobacteria bacterium]
MRVRIRHESRYQYGQPTDLGPHIVRLRPSDHTRAHVLSYNLTVAPKCEVKWQRDPAGNRIARATFPADAKASELRLVVDASFEIRPVNPFDFFVDDRCRELPFRYPDNLDVELAPYMGRPAEPGSLLAAFVEENRAHGYITDYLVALNSAVAKRVRYIIRNEAGIQTSEETLQIGSGSCRDSAVLLVDVLRAQGLAARFASGYLIQLADEGNIPDETKGVLHDVVDLHAWAEVYVPGAGWVGLDGTSGLLAGEGHIPLACTAVPLHASPIEGTASAPAEHVGFDLTIARLGHEPRPRRPYTDACWADMRALGRAVDEKIARAGITLTMGGEPTWTSRSNPRAPEWNEDALGPDKWNRGLVLATQLLDRLGEQGVILHRMGKHYPGESLPRWVMHLLWRADGDPIWRDRRWLDREIASYTATHTPDVPLRPMLDRARRFIDDLARRLNVGRLDTIRPGFEDPWHFIQEEENLPVDVDPLKADLEDSEARRRLARVLGRGMGEAVGFALPLGASATGFVTSAWSFRRDHLFLIPGDSPMGLRLPLQRIGGTPLETWVTDPSQHLDALPSADALWPRIEPQIRDRYPRDPRDPSDEGADRDHAGLGAHHDRGLGRGRGRGRDQDDAAGRRAATSPTSPPSWATNAPFGATAFVDGPYGQVTTGLCVEPRGSSLAVFLPPLPTTEHFLRLIAAIEETAEALETPVGLEGYPPPSDPRLKACMVTPDPGVLEVNIPVTRTFDEYVSLMESVTDAATHAGLTTEKYQLDGREVGPGGGHHLTLGGPSTPESPFLKNPALLGSLLRYIHNHPSLSYLFASIFVGPTSQAPRVDEARHDALYELEIALNQIDAQALGGGGTGWTPPWLTDRLLRHLLTDASGNTHRTEISIDKLYDPGSAAGRQGILEFRAFEMPAHERMAIAQMLLMRSITARLAEEPYTRPLIRFGSQLHDRYMLPHFMWKDLVDVIDDLKRAGLPVDEEMYLPFLDFKCPIMGRLDADDLSLEVRVALEPWIVLGEEPGRSGTVRYVDSSVERVQVKADGLIEGRHVVSVNGRYLPLRPTGRATEYVGGVRFRAWQPPNCLHPNIGIHHPLRFDLVDTWAHRALGAATYHVWHPEGRAFEDPPLTAFEAAARRAQRFTTEGHTPYPVHLEPSTHHPEQPYTLDLRRRDPFAR